ncbi:MAG: hypothetical protein HPY50_12320 [Firmicutes bacterium]|nr:hypothetical protein [Bacillota bacterium]
MVPDEIRFIERFGLLMEEAGGTKTLGRVFGYLMLTGEPKTLDEISSDLLFSKATASLTVRQGLLMALIEKVSRPGQRKDYYTASIRSWTRAIENKMKVIEEWNQIILHGLSIIPADNPSARENLEGMKDYLDFCIWYMSDIDEYYERWKRGEFSDRA